LRELSLHILDIAENALDAGATFIGIFLSENRADELFRITIEDNGRGIPSENLEKVLDPFFTTRQTRRVGLGLSLFRETSRRCGGTFTLTSRVGRGTRVEATFGLSHIDLPPMGDISGCISTILMGHPQVDLLYDHEVDGEKFTFDTREIREGLEEVPIHNPRVLVQLAQMIRKSEAALRTMAPSASKSPGPR
jgi:Histidine kinase-, DNA gyrase B-, and HSP90-like ATPase